MLYEEARAVLNDPPHLDGDNRFLVSVIEPNAQRLCLLQLISDAVKEIILLGVEGLRRAHELRHSGMRCLAR